MTSPHARPIAGPLTLRSVRADVGADVAFAGRWLLLGGAAGAWAGLLIGGVGGRLAMFVLRVTSSDSVRGVERNDGFTIGQFSGDTVFLLAITTVLGLFVGVVLVVVRSQLHGWLGVLLTMLAAGLLGTAAIGDRSVRGRPTPTAVAPHPGTDPRSHPSQPPQDPATCRNRRQSVRTDPHAYRLGLGGSFRCADPDAEIGSAYAMNRGGYSLPTDPREVALHNAVHQRV
jgi:hypothetical protein